jgi:hypothetical protein
MACHVSDSFDGATTTRFAYRFKLPSNAPIEAVSLMRLAARPKARGQNSRLRTMTHRIGGPGHADHSAASA